MLHVSLQGYQLNGSLFRSTFKRGTLSVSVNGTSECPCVCVCVGRVFFVFLSGVGRNGRGRGVEVKTGEGTETWRGAIRGLYSNTVHCSL